MERIVLLHSRLQLTITALLIALALWGLFCAARGRLGQGYLAGLWVAELLMLAQAGLGVLLLFGGAPVLVLGLHIVYGVIAVLILPGAIWYVGARSSRWEALVLVGACVFLLGVVGRASETALR